MVGKYNLLVLEVGIEQIKKFNHGVWITYS